MKEEEEKEKRQKQINSISLSKDQIIGRTMIYLLIKGVWVESFFCVLFIKDERKQFFLCLFDRYVIVCFFLRKDQLFDFYFFYQLSKKNTS